MGLDMHQRKALTEELARRYRTAGKKEKGKILDEFTSVTGYHRKYASHLLTHWGKTTVLRFDGKLLRLKAGRSNTSEERRGRTRVYDREVAEALKKVWAIFGLMCGKHLAVVLRTHLPHPQFLCELGLSSEVREKLQQISAATIDRLLSEERKRNKLKGTSHTKTAGGGILNRIPVRTFAEHPVQPGYFQADLVGHDGGDASGEYCYTLNTTDPATGWCEPRAVRNKAGKWTCEALDWIASHSPIAVHGWHTDNGTEFLNAHMERYCSDRRIDFTRSRIDKKNDNCHVEQKNAAVIRFWVGYLRYEGEQQCALLNELYAHLRLMFNFFYPQRKLIEKHRHGSKVTKRYDEPRSPYRRILESDYVQERTKEQLREQMDELNPLELTQRINEISQKLIAAASRESENQRESLLVRR